MLTNRWLGIVGWLLGAAAPCAVAASNAVPTAAAAYIVDVWRTEEGLPQSSVLALRQTRDGYLWLGTLNGLVRFDGVRFTVFDESNTTGLPSSRIVHLFEDRQGGLWLGTDTAGIALVRDGVVASLGIGRNAREGRLVATCEDALGAVWLYTADGQLWRYWQDRCSPFLVGEGRPSACRAIIAEPDGPLWIGTDWRQSAVNPPSDPASLELPETQTVPVVKLDFLLARARGGYWRLADGRIQQWRTNQMQLDLGAYPWGARTLVTAACEDGEGNLVVGTYGEGVFWFGSEGKVARIAGAQGLSHGSVVSLCLDREGSLWVGTDGGGLNRVKRRGFDVPALDRGWGVQSVCAAVEGEVWLGFNESGAAHWQGDRVEDFGAAQGLTNPFVWTVLQDAEHRVWAGTRGGGLFQLTAGRFESVASTESLPAAIVALHQDRAGRLWLGGPDGLACREAGGWRTFTKRDGLSADSVRALADDGAGNLWIGTVGGGLNRWRDGQFTAFRKSEDGLPSDDISALYADRDGVLWVGTSGSGLARFHEGKWTRYTVRDGLVSNSIGYLLEDREGWLWLGSNRGLMRVAKQALNEFARGAIRSVPCRAYGSKQDGLPTSECTFGSQPAAWRSPAGRLWFATIKGLVSVDPAQLNRNTNPPPVMIEAVLIDDAEQLTNGIRTALPAGVTLPASAESLEIQFTSLNLAAPDHARFRYRLDPHQTAWKEIPAPANGPAPLARYSKLPPGRYRFQVMACNEDNVWNEAPTTLAVTVLPPFWRKWWFLSATAAALLGAIVGVVHYLSTQRLQRQLASMRQKEALEKERARIARDLHDQLGANLTRVSLLSELVETDKDLPAEVESHSKAIYQTAQDTTRALDEIVWAANPANDTLEGLVNYVCKYAQEFLAVAGLRYRLEVPAELPAVAIAPDVRHNVFLAAKEAVNNVAKHAQASSVFLRLKLEPARFTLEIEDDGRGPGGIATAAARARNGLRNMSKRMEDVGGGFSIGPAPERGTCVRLTAPLGNR